jgi:hypothetical protein
LNLDNLSEGVESLVLQIDHQVEENDGIVGTVRPRPGALTRRGDFHAVGPGHR